MSRSDNVESHTLYAVWHPTHGWLRREPFGGYYERYDYQSKPFFWSRFGRAKALAKKAKAQLIVFDVTPTLRSWPAEEVDATK